MLAICFPPPWDSGVWTLEWDNFIVFLLFSWSNWLPYCQLTCIILFRWFIEEFFKSCFVSLCFPFSSRNLKLLSLDVSLLILISTMGIRASVICPPLHPFFPLRILAFALQDSAIYWFIVVTVVFQKTKKRCLPLVLAIILFLLHSTVLIIFIMNDIITY